MREKAFDNLRVFACVLVVLVHISAQGLAVEPVGGMAFAFCQCCNILAFSGVSIFVMMSGALALRPGRKVSVGEALRKRFLYFMFLYFLWKGLYLLFDLVRAGQLASLPAWKQLVLDEIGGRGFYHLWYLQMIAFLSLLVPLIYEGVQRREACLLYLVPFMLLALLFPTMFCFEFPFKYLLMDFQGQFETEYFLGYLGYFILGHFLYRRKGAWSAKRCGVLYAAGIAALVFGCVAGVMRSRQDGVFFKGFSSPFSITNMLCSSAIFVFFFRKEQKQADGPEKDQRFRRLTVRLCGLSLGIYLLHPFVIEVLKDCGVFFIERWTVLMVPLYAGLVFLIAAAAAFLVSRIPFIKKVV